MTLSARRPELKCLGKGMARMYQQRRGIKEAEAVFRHCPSNLKPIRLSQNCAKTPSDWVP